MTQHHTYLKDHTVNHVPVLRRPRRSPSRSIVTASILACVVATILASGSSATGPDGATDRVAARDVVFGERTAVPQASCRPQDRPETDLQGRIPPLDRATGRAAQGYTCNIDVIGRWDAPAYSTLDSYRSCAYYGLAESSRAVQVLDLRDPRRPRPTTRLTTMAMQNAGESLRVNQRRGLLVSTGYTNSYDDSRSSTAPWLDIYDISRNCRRPRLLSSTYLAPAMGHEGWFAPDGMTYFMSTCCDEEASTTFPIDISDPRDPVVMARWGFHRATHGGYTTEDNARTYVCRQTAPPLDAVITIDTSGPGGFMREPRIISTLPLEDNQFCQSVYRVTYHGKPYLLQFGERSGASPYVPTCERVADGWATFGYPRFIDISDEHRPRIVSRLLLEVDLSQNCSQVATEGAPLGFGYSVHHCSPDRLHDPTIMACSYFHAGMRVFDIRNPREPREIAYYNPGLNGVYGTASRPVIRTDRREIWMTNDVTGFMVVRLPRSLWPFRDAERCPTSADYYYKLYNPTSTCRTANLSAIP